MPAHNAFSRSEEARYIKVGIEAEIKRLQARLSELNGAGGAPASNGAVRKRRTMSVEARKRISEAAKRRWAQREAAATPATSEASEVNAEAPRRPGRPKGSGKKRGRKPGRLAEQSA